MLTTKQTSFMSKKIYKIEKITKLMFQIIKRKGWKDMDYKPIKDELSISDQTKNR